MRHAIASLALAAVAASCTKDNPEHCATATDCAAGQACDLGSMTCVAAVLTLDSEGFFVADDDRWWTVLTGPELAGTVDDPSNPTIQAFVDGVAIGLPATIAGGAWSLRLPDGTLTAAGTTIVIRLEAGDRTLELAQVIVGDVDGPALGLAPAAQVIDERADLVDFSSGVPHHDHVGAPVALGTDCPDVYKHAYLMESVPEGTEVAPNPLRFPALVGDVAPIHATAEYRVRHAGGSEIRTWAAGAAGVDVAADMVEHPIDLVRTAGTGVPELATYEGALEIDVRVTDWAGRQAMSTWCWTHHPLAAPLEVGSAGPAPGGVATWLLTNDPPLSELLNVDGAYQPVVDAPFTQYTSDTVHVEIDLTPPAGGSWSKSIVDDWVLTGTSPDTYDCFDVNGGPCPVAGPTPRADPMSSGALGSTAWAVTLHESGALIGACASLGGQAYRCTVPGRDGGAPRAFRIAASVRNLHDLRPTGTGVNPPFAEIALLGLTFTGKQMETFDRCTSTVVCGPIEHYSRIVAVDEAAVTFQTIMMAPASTPDPMTAAVTPAYYPTSFGSGAVWSSGNDDLPGAF